MSAPVGKNVAEERFVERLSPARAISLERKGERHEMSYPREPYHNETRKQFARRLALRYCRTSRGQGHPPNAEGRQAGMGAQVGFDGRDVDLDVGRNRRLAGCPATLQPEVGGVAVTTHERLSKDVRVTMYFKPVRSDTTIRLTCVCGFKTDWYEGSDAGSELADKAMAKHFDFWSDGPKRDCGHDFTHAGLCLRCPPVHEETL